MHEIDGGISNEVMIAPPNIRASSVAPSSETQEGEYIYM